LSPCAGFFLPDLIPLRRSFPLGGVAPSKTVSQFWFFDLVDYSCPFLCDFQKGVFLGIFSSQIHFFLLKSSLNPSSRVQLRPISTVVCFATTCLADCSAPHSVWWIFFFFIPPLRWFRRFFCPHHLCDLQVFWSSSSSPYEDSFTPPPPHRPFFFFPNPANPSPFFRSRTFVPTNGFFGPTLFSPPHPSPKTTFFQRTQRNVVTFFPF